MQNADIHISIILYKPPLPLLWKRREKRRHTCVKLTAGNKRMEIVKENKRTEPPRGNKHMETVKEVKRMETIKRNKRIETIKGNKRMEQSRKIIAQNSQGKQKRRIYCK